MSNFSGEEIVEAVEVYGSELQGNATALASVLRSIADRLEKPKDGDDSPKYHIYEDSPYGRSMADGEVESALAWQWIRSELMRLEHTLKHSAEFYI
jgi:hypothetical protein